MIRSSLATKLLVLSLIPAASVIVAWLGISRSFSSSDLAESQVLRAIAALELANDVAALADEAILEERGFLVTGGEGFADPYYNAVGMFTARVAELDRLFTDAPERQRHVRALAAVFDRWQREVAIPAIAARRRNETSASAALVANAGRQLSNEIDALAKQLTHAQGAVVRDRLLESGQMRASATQWALIVMALTIGLAMAGGIIFILQLRRRLSLLEDAAEAIARGDFDRHAPIAGSDEIGRLALSFNTMADQVRERTLEAAGLRKLSELLQACGSVAEAFEVTERVVPALLPGLRGVIQIINPSRSQLDVVALLGMPAEGTATDPPPPARVSYASVPPQAIGTERSSARPSEHNVAPSDCWGFRRGVAHRVTPEDNTVRCRHPGTGDSYLCIPMLAHGEALGVLTLSPAPEAEQATRAERFAEQIGLAVANLRLRDSLRTQAVRDGLTGLYNRRYFEEAAERELARAKRHRRPLVFMVLDVDHFKRFNDTHGHDAGDYLLREVGQLLRSSVRQSDVACRYGGEEFVLILPESSPDEALRRANQIRESFRRLGLAQQGKGLGPVTVSIGIAAYPEHGLDRDVILRNADAALYRAKHEGRDRALIAPANDMTATEPPRSSARTGTGVG